MRCEDCRYFLKQFSLCTSGFVRYVDPDAPCVSFSMERSGPLSPCKQLTPAQIDLLPKTDFLMTWDEDGWLTDVALKGMPNTPAISSIPREAVVFAYYDQMTTGKFVYSRNPRHPAILIYRPITSDSEYRIYKQWNPHRFPQHPTVPSDVMSKRMPAHSFPSHLSVFFSVARLMYFRVKDKLGDLEKQAGHNSTEITAEFIPLEGDVDHAIMMWKRCGYPAGYVEMDGRQIAYFAYKFRSLPVVVFDGRNRPIDADPVVALSRRVTVPEATNERFPLQKLNLSKHCMVCGLENESPYDITYPCHFCFQKISSLVFNPPMKETTKP